jgi:hypothetical protein
MQNKIHYFCDQAGLVVTLTIGIRRVLGSKLGRNTGYTLCNVS